MRKLMTLVFVVGCGGSSAKYHVDDQSLAALSMEEKQAIFAAQNEKNQAQAEMQNFQAQVKQTDHDLDIADNEYKTAKLQLDTAKINVKAAEGDMNRKQQAQRDVQIGELGVKTADAKVDWLKKKRKWLDASADAAERHVAQADARAELEKAKLAQAKGIKPDEKFDPMLFEQDYQEKARKYNDAKLDADRMKPDVDGKEREYMTQQQAYDQARQALGMAH